jgi:hypothetical protein
MTRKKDFPALSGWGGEDKPNYELEFLRMENLKLKQEVDFLGKSKLNKDIEKDIAALLKVSMQMKFLLEQVRSQVMIPMELGKQIDRVIKEIENYG